MARAWSTRNTPSIGLVFLLVFGLMSADKACPRELGPGAQPVVLQAGDVTFEFVRIPTGQFLMGSQSGDSDEQPVHGVRIDHDFCMGETEVTVRQFRAFAKATGYRTDAEKAGWASTCPLPGLHSHQRGLDWRRPGFDSTGDHPVVVISRNDAMAFCRWLSEQTGRAIRLPTEAEWEYAARAGSQDDSGEDADGAAWYEENASSAQPVGVKKANVWGLHDMRGNACEWCFDVYRADYEETPADGSAPTNDPFLPPPAWRYVMRGGSWASPKRQLSLTYRSRRMQSFSRPDTGFRIVVSADDPLAKGALAPVYQAKRDHATCTCDEQTRRTVLKAHGVRFEFARIPAGEFMMGGTGEIEKPLHQVHIGYEFDMGTTEVTVAQFRAFIEATGYVTDGQKEGYGWLRRGVEEWECEDNLDWRRVTSDESDDHPASLISWYDAMAFCRWLSTETGQEIRLPSEAEWEYACRVGTTGLYAGEISAMGWSRHNSWDRTHPVAQKRPNAWGLYDMHGNVWEWCLDFFALSYDGAPTDGRPRWNVECPTDVVSRGGSFANPPGWLASGCRMGTPPSASHYNNGFRLVRALEDTIDNRREPIAAGDALVPLRTTFPKPMFITTPQDFRVPRLKPIRREPGPPFLVPAGTRNVALGAPVSASDEEPIIGALKMITDGDKEGADGSYVELGPFVQHVTIDLQSSHEIYAVQVWHYHGHPRVYFDVIVQISNDPDFINGVQTIFNNDMDNSAGLGVGTDMHYVDTHFGEIFDARGLPGRYVRLYSRGNTSNELNHYTEVEVYGRPSEDAPKLVPLKIDLPHPFFVGLPSDCFHTPGMERAPRGPRPPILVPRGTTNVAFGKWVSTSAGEPLRGRLDMIVDGDKEALDDSLVELASSVQHVTIDLLSAYQIDVVVVWHNHKQPRVYFDVIAQVSEDRTFRTYVQTVFNNDVDDSVHLGTGRDLHYVETHEGKIIQTRGMRGRYVRLYSNGNTANDLNHYIEVEVHGRPVLESDK